jgi:hypothetical protein
MPSIKRLIPTLAICALSVGAWAPSALASTTQESIIQDDSQLHGNLTATLQTMRDLGDTRVKVAVHWSTIAPDPTSKKAPKGFSAANPAAYPAANWVFLDSVVRQARADGLQVGFQVAGPAPAWAIGPGAPSSCAFPCGQWKPSASAFGAFVQAVGKRYNGSYTPSGASSALPRVNWFSIWDEPNYGPTLAPQAIDNNTVYEAAVEYRGLVNAAWSGLAGTGHKPGRDTILIGETAPRGRLGPGQPGNFSGTMPLLFLQALYCVNASYQPLTGAAAATYDCPSKSKFRSENPGLFQASGYADHPYAQGTPPNIPTYACGTRFCFNTKTKKSDPYYFDFAELPRLEKTLDKLGSTYGSHTKFPIWNTEFGYVTNPPDNQTAIARKEALSPTVAGYYMNWSEYLSYTQPRVASYAQYLLVDPPSGTFADGLFLANGKPLANYAAYAAPLYLPTTSASHSTSLLVWGGLRAASAVLANYGMAPQVQIQFAPGSSSTFTTVRTVTITSSRGYFETHQPFTQSGQVRLAYISAGGSTLYSRTQAISIK